MGVRVSSCHLLNWGPTDIRCTQDSYVYVACIVLFRERGFDGIDETDSFILAAKRHAEAALHETSPELTALEKAMWLKLKRGERPCKKNKSA